MIWEWKTVWLLLWLVLWTVWDIRCLAIYSWQAILVLVLGLLWQLTDGQLFTGSVLGGLALGAGFWIFSLLSGDRFGQGDALVILNMGLYCGFAVTMSAAWIGLLLASLWSVYLLLVKRCGSRQGIPLIPFLTVGYVVMMLAGQGGSL